MCPTPQSASSVEQGADETHVQRIVAEESRGFSPPEVPRQSEQGRVVDKSEHCGRGRRQRVAAAVDPVVVESVCADAVAKARQVQGHHRTEAKRQYASCRHLPVANRASGGLVTPSLIRVREPS